MTTKIETRCITEFRLGDILFFDYHGRRRHGEVEAIHGDYMLVNCNFDLINEGYKNYKVDKMTEVAWG